MRKERTPLERILMDIIADRTNEYGAVNTIEWLKECDMTEQDIIDLEYFEKKELDAANIVESLDTMIEAVVLMDEIVRDFNDEDIHMYWLTYGLPDGSDEETIKYDVDSKESYEEFAAAFLECISLAKVGEENITEKIADFANAVELTLYD